jgi:hypothetical protein
LLSKNIKIKIYRTIILPVVLYGGEMWFLKVKEGQRLRVFKNSGLMKIFGPERDEITGQWRRLRNDELYVLYSPSHIIWAIRSRIMRDYLKDLCIDWKTVLKWIFKMRDGEAWTGLLWLRIGRGSRH